jgi:hypothetical protein
MQKKKELIASGFTYISKFTLFLRRKRVSGGERKFPGFLKRD